MAGANDGQRTRHAVGVFHRAATLRSSLSDLMTAGTECDALCLAAQQALMGSLEPPDGGVGEIFAGLSSDTIFVERDGRSVPVRIASGARCGKLVAILDGGGTAGRPWLGQSLIPRHARTLEDHLVAGRYLLWVRLFDAEDEKRVCTILLKHSEFPVQVHDLTH